MVTLRLLGSMDLEEDGRRACDALLRRPKPMALLAYLAAATPRGYHRRDSLLALFWPELSHAHARHALRQSLHVLRRELGEQALITRGEGDVAVNDEAVSVDVVAFEQAVERGELALADRHYRGDFLAGLFVSDAPEFERWAEGERERLARTYRAVMEQLAERATQAGDRLAAVSWWRRVSEQDPYSTRVAIRLMEALEAAGDRSGALQYAQRHAARLWEELGAEAAPDVVALAERLRARPVRQQIAPDRLTDFRAAVAGRYAVQRQVGSGGMATVYLAEDLKHHRQVAIKVLRPELSVTLGPERFVREIEIAAQLTHPHILPLHDSGEADGFLYYVMPYIEGESLRERLEREGTLAVADAIRLTDDIAAALSYAHAQGIVHRDVKPENIMLTGGRAVVADFGIARAVTAAGGEGLTGTGLAIGTPAYMSPEQAMGQKDIDARSDVYALGCVVYEMVAGQPPLDGATPQELLASHALDRVPKLRTRGSAIPLFVERAVAKALAKDPGERFQTPSALAEALTTERVVARLGPTRWRRRTIPAAFGVALVAAAGWWFATVAGAPPIERLAVLPFRNLMNDPEQEYLVQGMHESVISELTQAGLTVIARPSVIRYGNSNKSGRQIARELGVDALVEGSAFRAGDSVGIRVRLLDPETEEYIWSGSYEADLTNVFALYRDVAAAIVDEIELALPQAGRRPATAPVVDPQVYQAYLKGQFHAARFTPQDLTIALQYFNQVLERDPNYAPAYAGIGVVWARRMVLGLAPPLEAGTRQRAAAERAVGLDSTLAWGWFELGSALAWYEWDWKPAEAAFRRAIELDPNDPELHAVFALFLTALGRSREATPHVEGALDLDPYNPFIRMASGIQMVYAGRMDDGIAELRRANEMAPEHPVPHRFLAVAFRNQSLVAEAATELRMAFELFGDAEAVGAWDRAYAGGDYRDAALAVANLFEARARSEFVKPSHIAWLFDEAGAINRAIEWLERGYYLRDYDMIYLAVAPYSDELRADPRFRELLRRMKLPS